MEEQEPVTLVSLRVTNSNPKLQVMVPPPRNPFLGRGDLRSQFFGGSDLELLSGHMEEPDR